MDTPYQPLLSQREHSKRRLLARLYALNSEGLQPTKYRLVGRVPGSTRTLKYKMITALIDLGLAVNRGSPGRYALDITALGKAELRYWTVKEGPQ